MTYREQLEMILEALNNHEKDAALAIFHDIAVGKSREIYESLLAQDFSFGEEEEEEPENENPFGSSDDADDSEDASDDMSDDDGEEDEVSDSDDDSMDLDADESGDVEERVDDLETALQELQAEFDKLLAGEEGEDHAEMDQEVDSPFPPKDAVDEVMFEYVEQIGGKTYDKFAKMGEPAKNNKSVVPGKNDMGGTTANIVNGGTEEGVLANKGQLKGNGVFKGTKPKVIDSGNRNVVGGKSSKTDFTTRQSATTTETGVNATSPIKGASRKSK